jgi:hypothetical protein
MSNQYGISVKNALHGSELEAFEKWVSANGYIVVPCPPKATYEVLRFKNKKNENCLVHRNLKTEFLTMSETAFRAWQMWKHGAEFDQWGAIRDERVKSK